MEHLSALVGRPDLAVRHVGIGAPPTAAKTSDRQYLACQATEITPCPLLVESLPVNGRHWKRQHWPFFSPFLRQLDHQARFLTRAWLCPPALRRVCLYREGVAAFDSQNTHVVRHERGKGGVRQVVLSETFAVFPSDAAGAKASSSGARRGRGCDLQGRRGSCA